VRYAAAKVPELGRGGVGLKSPPGREGSYLRPGTRPAGAAGANAQRRARQTATVWTTVSRDSDIATARCDGWSLPIHRATPRRYRSPPPRETSPHRSTRDDEQNPGNASRGCARRLPADADMLHSLRKGVRSLDPDVARAHMAWLTPNSTTGPLRLREPVGCMVDPPRTRSAAADSPTRSSTRRVNLTDLDELGTRRTLRYGALTMKLANRYPRTNSRTVLGSLSRRPSTTGQHC